MLAHESPFKTFLFDTLITFPIKKISPAGHGNIKMNTDETKPLFT
jgi:hypothetical protein